MNNQNLKRDELYKKFNSSCDKNYIYLIEKIENYFKNKDCYIYFNEASFTVNFPDHKNCTLFVVRKYGIKGPIKLYLICFYKQLKKNNLNANIALDYCKKIAYLFKRDCTDENNYKPGELKGNEICMIELENKYEDFLKVVENTIKILKKEFEI